MKGTTVIKIEQTSFQDADFVGRVQIALLNSAATKVVIETPPIVSNDTKKLINNVIAAVIGSQLQTLKSVQVNATDHDWQIDSQIIRDNFFIEEFKIPVARDTQQVINEVQSRNKLIAYMETHSSTLGHSDNSAAIIGPLTVFGIVGIPVLMTFVGHSLFSWLGITATTVLGAFATTLTMLAFYPVVAVLPFLLVSLPVGLYYLVKSQQHKKLVFTPGDLDQEVMLTLSSEQITRCNFLIEALNKTRELNIPSIRLESGRTQQTLKVSRQAAKLFMGFVQLRFDKTQMASAASGAFVTKQLEIALAIAHSCGYDNGKFGVGPSLKETFFSLNKLKLKDIDLVRLFRFNNPFRGHRLELFERGNFARYSNYCHKDRVTYTNVAAGIEAIKNNEVYAATLIINSQSLEQLAIACNSNSTMSELTLSFAKAINCDDDEPAVNTIGVEDAKRIAQIILRNSTHFTQLNLTNVTLTPAALVVIKDALRLNGAITMFNSTANDHDIDDILKRNQALVESSGLISSGVIAGFAIGLLVTVVVFPTVASAGLALFSLTVPLFVAACVAPPVVGGLLGALVASPAVLLERYRARASSEKLRNALSQQLVENKTHEVVMTGQQYKDMANQLRRDQKIKPELRHDQKADEKLNALRAKKQTESKSVEQHLPKAQIEKVNGVAVTNENRNSFKESDLVTVQLSAARHQYFSLGAQLAVAGEKWGQADFVKVAAYDTYRDIKDHAKEIVAQAAAPSA